VASNGINFASTGQQLVESLLGGVAQSTNGLLSSSNAAAGTSAISLPDGWSTQAAQQLLAQLGLSGQTLYANSDGTISVDGNLLTIQGRPLQLAGISGDQAQLMAADNTSATSGGGWTWQQPVTNAPSTAAQPDAAAGNAGMVLYQLLSNGTAAAVGDGSAATVASVAAAQQAASSGQVYYSLDAYGQLIAHESKAPLASTNESNLQQHIVNLRRALEEKTNEAETLRSQIAEVYAVIKRYNAGRGGGGGSNGEEQSGGETTEDGPSLAGGDDTSAVIKLE
jgi:hypothetical protein